MIFIVTIDVRLRVWDGGAEHHIHKGEVVFEEATGFVVEDEISLDDLAETAKQITWAATDDRGGYLSVAHVSWNHPHAHREVEITLELVGAADDERWTSLLQHIARSLSQPIWDASRAGYERHRGESSSTS
jgi:hypothetical protein